MNTYIGSKKLFSITIRVSKNDAAFLYFILESYENLCFYSTLDSSIHEPYRDIHIRTTIEFKDELMRTIRRLNDLESPINILQEEIVTDI